MIVRPRSQPAYRERDGRWVSEGHRRFELVALRRDGKPEIIAHKLQISSRQVRKLLDRTATPNPETRWSIEVAYAPHIPAGLWSDAPSPEDLAVWNHGSNAVVAFGGAAGSE